MDAQKGALAGVRVLDLTRVLAGPYSTMILSDMGAEVIKIEQPEKGDDTRHLGPFVHGESLYYMTNNRNKYGVTLNLKASEGKEIFKELVKKSDLVIENYRPGTMEKLGLGYDILKEVNPRIIYGSISGFGHSGRYEQRPGYDIIAQAMSGLMSTTGWPDSGPTRTGTPLGDVLSGLWLTIGVLGALQARNHTGRGQKVDIALVDAAVSAMGNINMIYFGEHRLPQRIGNRYESMYPYDSFACADGECVIGAGNNKLWKLFCGIMKHPELADDPEYADTQKRIENHVAIKKIIEAWSARYTVAEVVQQCLDGGVPSAPIYDIEQVYHDPHIAGDRQMFIEQEHPQAGKITVTGSPLKLSDTPVQFKTPAPSLGQYNEKVYEELLGLRKDEIEALKEKKVL
ncbi:CaiB/BaiF CoA-transferase family protein [uncultured Megasphaera sp.]|uniref:CaiB/BaiF CoA transferase family protein n=1 Tax=uncultured Megasphaera sp. TaxID=165188 RepID=UPI002598E611|nr:CoA transferase [uncultured Megasphaera sp.]